MVVSIKPTYSSVLPADLLYHCVWLNLSRNWKVQICCSCLTSNRRPKTLWLTLRGQHASVPHHIVWRRSLGWPHVLIHAVANPLPWPRTMSHTGCHGIIHGSAVLRGEWGAHGRHITVGWLVGWDQAMKKQRQQTKQLRFSLSTQTHA